MRPVQVEPGAAATFWATTRATARLALLWLIVPLAVLAARPASGAGQGDPWLLKGTAGAYVYLLQFPSAAAGLSPSTCSRRLSFYHDP